MIKLDLQIQFTRCLHLDLHPKLELFAREFQGQVPSSTHSFFLDLNDRMNLFRGGIRKMSKNSWKPWPELSRFLEILTKKGKTIFYRQYIYMIKVKYYRIINKHNEI